MAEHSRIGTACFHFSGGTEVEIFSQDERRERVARCRSHKKILWLGYSERILSSHRSTSGSGHSAAFCREKRATKPRWKDFYRLPSERLWSNDGISLVSA